MRKKCLRNYFVLIFIVLSVITLFTVTCDARPIVVLTTDFGLDNEAVGICHGAILSIDSDIAIVDLCNTVTPYDIRLGALILKDSVNFPLGSVFVTVIDPGVGTSRKPVAVKTKNGFYYIAPNNGLLTYVIKKYGIESSYLIKPEKFITNYIKGTFDGRDLFSPAGAIVASNGGDLSKTGDQIKETELVMLDIKDAVPDVLKGQITGVCLRIDKPYGNVWTNITQEDLKKINADQGNKFLVNISGKEIEIPFVLSFGDVPVGMPLCYMNSRGTLAIAINQGNFQEKYNIKDNDSIVIKLIKK